MDTDTDTALWAASLRGDGDVFGVLFDRHHPRVHRHATRLLTLRSDAEDVTAAAFLELWRRRDHVHLSAGSVLPAERCRPCVGRAVAAPLSLNPPLVVLTTGGHEAAGAA